jgi:predicted phosphodiesterase
MNAQQRAVGVTSLSDSVECVSSSNSRPKLMFFGDPHGNFDFVIQSVQRHAPEAIVLLGDLQARRPLEIELAPITSATEVWFIHGNHDTDSVADHDNLFGSELAHRNLHGRVVEIAGFRVAGLSGIFRESIWAPPLEPAFASVADRLRVIRPGERWRGGLPLRHRSSIFPDEYEHLKRQRADILVTHEGLGGHPHGWSALDDLAIALGVQVAVHGHLHQTIDYVADGRLDASAGYKAFGVAPEHFLVWPPHPAPFTRGAL